MIQLTGFVGIHLEDGVIIKEINEKIIEANTKERAVHYLVLRLKDKFPEAVRIDPNNLKATRGFNKCRGRKYLNDSRKNRKRR